MVAQAERMLAETRANIATKEQEVEELRKSVDLRRAEKEAAEAPEKEALDKYAEEEERQRQAKEEHDRQASEQEALEAMTKLDTNADGKVSRSEVMADFAFDTVRQLLSQEREMIYLQIEPC